MTLGIRKYGVVPGFWFFQIAGWIGFAFFDATISEHSFITNFRHFLVWLTSLIIGFTITVGLRIYYKHYFRKNSGIFMVILLIISGSLTAAFLWHYLFVFVTGALYSFEQHIYTPRVYIFRIYQLLWPLLVWSALYFGLRTWINLIEERIRSGKADADTRQAQLQMLRYQINPHFLFNTLNSIKGLMRREAAVAEIMITEFSEFLRYTLQHDKKTYITLEEEIEIVKKYLLLEKIRFDNRLIYSFENTAESLKVSVLCFLLQPFVENAIKHGLKNSPSGIWLHIRTYLENDELHIEIENSGRWIPESNESGKGIINVADRLKTAYPGNHTFSIEKGEKSVKVTITINPEE